mgnify:CR=1 FL=1
MSVRTNVRDRTTVIIMSATQADRNQTNADQCSSSFLAKSLIWIIPTVVQIPPATCAKVPRRMDDVRDDSTG